MAIKQIDGALPSNIEAEQAVLGSCLIDQRRLDSLGFLRPEDFYLPVNAEIFAAMEALRSQDRPADVATLADYLSAHNRLDEVGGAGYLASLSMLTPTSMHAVHYGRIVQRHSVLRRLIDAGNRIAELGYDGRLEPEAALSKAETALAEIRDLTPADDESFADMIDRVVQDVIQPGAESPRMATGFGPLDGIISGVHREELVVLVGLPSAGKTSFAATMLWQTAKVGRPGVLFSCEVGRDQIGQKLLCLESNIPWSALELRDLSAAQKLDAVAAGSVIRTLPLEVVDSSSWSIGQIRSEARRLQQIRALDFVAIDYLGLLRSEDAKAPEYQEIGRAVVEAKRMARELECGVILLVQFNREGEKTGTPDIRHLFGAASIRQHADQIWVLNRPPEFDPYDQQPVEPVLVTVAKNRNGDLGRAQLGFRGSHMQFCAMAHELRVLPPPSAGEVGF